MLRADRDQDLVRGCPDAAPAEKPRLDLLDQQRIVAVDQIAGPAADFDGRQRLHAAFPPAGDRHLRRIELTVDEWIRVFLPILGLDDVALTRDGEAHPRFPSGRGWRVAERRRPGTRRCAASEDFGVDEMATAALGPQITLVDEQLVGERD